MKDNNINKACRYYLLRDKDIRLDLILSFFVVLAFIIFFYKGAFESKAESFVLLLLYVLIIGLTQITANSMVVNLTVKDKLNKRTEFILASGNDIKNIIKVYGLEMWRISSIIPFLLFFLTYVFYNFEQDFRWIVGVYLSTILMLYLEIIFLNIFALGRKNFKFFKSLVFLGTTIIIYMVGSFSSKILILLDKYNFNLAYILIGINIFLILIFGISSFINLARMNNESVINREGTWS